MTLTEARKVVDEISVVAGHDDEVAHSLEDDLHISVLRAIAAGMDGKDAAELASEALRTCDMDFCRWCA